MHCIISANKLDYVHLEEMHQWGIFLSFTVASAAAVWVGLTVTVKKISHKLSVELFAVGAAAVPADF